MDVFHIYCNCGAGGAMKEVHAIRVNLCLRKPQFLGDRKGKVVPANKCLECGQLWRAPAPRGPRGPRKQTTFNF